MKVQGFTTKQSILEKAKKEPITKKEVITQLEGLIDYAIGEINISDCDDIWFKDVKALLQAVEILKKECAA